jgi:hypothetical protein
MRPHPRDASARRGPHRADRHQRRWSRGHDPARRVTVTVNANFNVVTGRVLGTFRGTIPLTASTTMRHESF